MSSYPYLQFESKPGLLTDLLLWSQCRPGLLN